MASLIQAEITGLLNTLGLEQASSGPPGSPETLEITGRTVAVVQSLVGKTVTVDASGKITGP